jgi:hypothetical protein
MKKLIGVRYPIYEKSDIIIHNNDISPDKTVDLVLTTLNNYFHK